MDPSVLCWKDPDPNSGKFVKLIRLVLFQISPFLIFTGAGGREHSGKSATTELCLYCEHNYYLVLPCIHTLNTKSQSFPRLKYTGVLSRPEHNVLNLLAEQFENLLTITILCKSQGP